MPSPFYNAIKGTTAGTPGTGAFTPNAAASGFRAWSNAPTGWIGLVRFDDGSAWELSYCYWNGATLSRSSTQLFDSSTGSALSLTSAALATMTIDASDVMSHLGTTRWAMWTVGVGIGSPTAIALGAPTGVGTSAGQSLANTNYLTMQPRAQATSLTTANAQAGWISTTANAIVSTSAGKGGFEFVFRGGVTGVPTGPRLFIGMTSVTYQGSTAEPSALTSHVAAFTKDSTDTNIQLLVNSNAGSGTKTDTGIPLTVNGWYEMSIWMEPGGSKVYGLLIRMDTGDIWLGSTTTDVPGDGALLFPQALGGLNGTNTGTAIVMQIGSLSVRAGS